MKQQKFRFLILAGFLLSTLGYQVKAKAIDIPDRSFTESLPQSADDFPATGFSFKSCSVKIPVKKGQNPWLRIYKKKSKPAAMNPAPASWIESYFVTPSNKTKAFAIHNQEDSIYNSPTTLARIDCKNGLIYFQHVIREPVTTNEIRVYDLVTGTEHKVIEGAVTFSLDGKHLMSASASDQETKCGRSANCNIQLKFYSCKGRKSQHGECKLEKDYSYTATSRSGRALFIPSPVKWKEKKKDVSITIGGSKQSPAKIACEVAPKLHCNIANLGKMKFTQPLGQ
jgi:hypothetical protein